MPQSRITIEQGAMSRLKDGLAAGVVAMAEEVARSAAHPKIQRRVEVTGRTPGQVHVQVLFDSPAAELEHGTAAHDIVARGGVLKLQNGRFARKVRHPGSKAQPFITPALVAAENRSSEIIQRGVAAHGGA